MELAALTSPEAVINNTKNLFAGRHGDGTGNREIRNMAIGEETPDKER